MVILTAALDLVGPTVPKAVVLLTTVFPGLGTKILAPTFVHLIPYSLRIWLLVGLSTMGMLLIALTPGYTDLKGKGVVALTSVIATKMTGVALSAISSAIGEVTFLGLVHFYGPFSLAGWGSGTGAAGLVGAGAYSVATTGWGFSPQGALFASAFLPMAMLAGFFLILPKDPIKHRQSRAKSGLDTEQPRRFTSEHGNGSDATQSAEEDSSLSGVQDAYDEEQEGLISHDRRTKASRFRKKMSNLVSQLISELHQARDLFYP